MKTKTRDWTHSDNLDKSPKQPVAAWVSCAAGEVSRQTGGNPLLLTLAACVVALCGCAEQASSAATKLMETPFEVKAIHPHRGQVYRYINLPGEVRPLYEVTLFAKVDGYLETLTVDKGDSVKAGGLIADIDVPELRANLVKYKAELELAQAEFKQWSEAANTAGVPAADAEAAKNRLAVAGGKLSVAKG